MDCVTLWFGFFPSEERLEDYLHEEAGEGDDAPWSAFAEDTGVDLLAIERIESSFTDEPTSDARALLRGHELPPGLVDAVEGHWSVMGGRVLANAALVVWGGDPPPPRSIEAEDYALVQVGSFRATA